MLTIRCTRKLLKRLGRDPEPAPPPSSTILGDWYANLIVFGQTQVVIFVSGRTLLPVLIEARGAETMFERFNGALRDVLVGLQVPPALIEKELGEMGSISVAATASRSVLGTMNEFAFMAGYQLKEEPPTLAQLSLDLAETPCGAIDGFPCDKARAAFGLRPIPLRRATPLRLVP